MQNTAIYFYFTLLQLNCSTFFLNFCYACGVCESILFYFIFYFIFFSQIVVSLDNYFYKLNTSKFYYFRIQIEHWNCVLRITKKQNKLNQI